MIPPIFFVSSTKKKHIDRFAQNSNLSSILSQIKMCSFFKIDRLHPMPGSMNSSGGLAYSCLRYYNAKCIENYTKACKNIERRNIVPQSTVQRLF